MPVETSHEIDPGGDVAPLIGPAELKRAPVAAVELYEVHRLEDHVAELGERQALTAEARTDRLARQHCRDRHVLADVTQEPDQGERLEPRSIVLERHGPRHHVAEESLELTGDAGRVVSQCRRIQQDPLARATRGITDHAGCAARNEDRPMTRIDQSARQHDSEQVAHVQ